MISTFKIICKTAVYNDVKNSSSYVSREGRMLKKMLDRGSSKRGPTHSVISKNFLPEAYDNKGSNKRTIMLNKLYMERIEEVIYTGDFASVLKDLGVKITRVNLAPTLHFLSVYWVPEKNEVDEELVAYVMQNSLKEIQNGMASVTRTRRVPLIKFVKDMRLESETRLQSVFQMIDCGEEFEPNYPKTVITPNHAPAPGELPKMRHDILGLDVEAIKKRISTAIFRSKVVTGKLPNRENASFGKLIPFTKKEFFKFYKRRRIEDIKLKKALRADGDNVRYTFHENYGNFYTKIDEENYYPTDELYKENEEFLESDSHEVDEEQPQNEKT